MAQRASAITSRIVGITDRLRPQRPGQLDADALVREVLRHYPEGDGELVRRAFVYASEAHLGQKRISGEPYISHPAAVGMLVAELGMDPATVAAALLHDVPEDTAKKVEDIERDFGEEIGRLVDGVTKLSRLSGQSRDQHQAENIRKMLLAMADDLRVVIIKLCDRLHNMRTLAPLPPEKQKRIARQTMDIYAPLAHRLGIWQIKWELEDLAFKYLEPDHYKEVAEQLAARRQVRERYINETMKTLRDELEKAGVRADLSGRAKHLWSIAQKMRRKGVGFEEVYDVLAIRVIVDDVPSCYAALGVVHTLCRRSRGSSTTTSRCPRRTCTSRCIRRSSGLAASRSRSRCARETCTTSRSTASRRTGATRKAARATATTSPSSRGSVSSSNGSTTWLTRKSSSSRSRSTFSRTKFSCSRRRARSRGSPPVRRRSTSRTGSTPTSGTARSARR